MKSGSILFGQAKGHLQSIRGNQELAKANLPKDIMDMCLIREDKWLAIACGLQGGLSILNEKLIVVTSFFKNSSLVAVSYYKESMLLVQHRLLILFDYSKGEKLCDFNLNSNPFNLIPIALSTCSGRGRVITNESPQNSAKECNLFIVQSEKKVTLLTIEEGATGFDSKVITISGKRGEWGQGIFVEKKANEIIISTSEREGSLRSLLQYKVNIE
ncbi:hypothetical protein FGO68_gene8970 [Halteria grandinella]|uniref:Uncharacterized protein n=1 Tax=Halteria grandinella TaxID=5974 RepID=A0A8J8T4Y7_HALGN|nr:hypothetical protein FGO68_gene8970 [Halteria grandinella]